VVWRLDRLGRSLPHLLQTVEDLADRGVGFKSLTEAIDTTTSGGKLIFSIFGALAEFERNRAVERSVANSSVETLPNNSESHTPKVCAPAHSVAELDDTTNCATKGFGRVLRHSTIP
jgi:hypothetical protein